MTKDFRKSKPLSNESDPKAQETKEKIKGIQLTLIHIFPVTSKSRLAGGFDFWLIQSSRQKVRDCKIWEGDEL